LPLLFQVGFGLSPLQVGLLVLAVFAVTRHEPLTTPVLRRLNFRTILISNGFSTLRRSSPAFSDTSDAVTVVVILLFLAA